MKRKCMKRLFLLILVSLITLAFFSCSDGGDDKNESGNSVIDSIGSSEYENSDVLDGTSGEKANVVELSICNESSYDLADVSWRGIAFYSSVDGRMLLSSSVAKNNVEEDVGGYVFFTRCGTVPAKLRTQKFVTSPYKFTFTDYTPVVEVGNTENIGTLANIKLSIPDYYTVSFESNGGSYIEPYTVQRGKEISVAPALQMEDVAFVGWYLDKDFKQKVEFPYVPESDVVLYAEWKNPPKAVPFTASRKSSVIKIQISPSDDEYFDYYRICCYQVFGSLVTKTVRPGPVSPPKLVKEVTTRDLSYELNGLDGKYYRVELYVVDTFGQQSEMYYKSF